MISNPVLQWLLSALFVVVVLYALVKTVTTRSVVTAVSYGTHVLMGVAMFAMIWPWGMHLLLELQVVVFSAATLWFVWLFLRRVRRRSATGTCGDGQRSPAGALAYHVGMMAAMVLMALSMMQMGLAGGAASDGSSSGHCHDHMGSMPGMDMPGHAAESMSMGFPLWVGLSSTACVIAFAIAALYFTVSAVAGVASADRWSPPRRARIIDAVWNMLMAVGMAALFLPMASWG